MESRTKQSGFNESSLDFNNHRYKIRGTKVTSPYPVQITPAEARLVFSLQKHFNPENIFPELYLPKVTKQTRHAADLSDFTLGAETKNLSGSEYTQIDCLAINQQGIFVFESKDYSGVIYGDADDHLWTQVLGFGQNKYTFYNPIRQNATHIIALADFLPDIFPIFSIVVFGREATLMKTTNVPERCFVITQPQIYNLFNQLPKSLSDIDIVMIYQYIQDHRTLPDAIVRREHITDIQDSLAKPADRTL